MSGSFVLKNKSIIVTGASTEFGRRVVKRLADFGAHVLIAGRPEEPILELVNKLTDVPNLAGLAEPFIGDITIESEAELCCQTAISLFDKIDTLIHFLPAEPDLEETAHLRTFDFDRLIFENIRGLFLMVRSALPELKKRQGVILSVTADGDVNGKIRPAEAANRAWVHEFMRALAIENEESLVRATSVSIVETGVETDVETDHLDMSVESFVNALSNLLTDETRSRIEMPSYIPTTGSPERSHRSEERDLSL